MKYKFFKSPIHGIGCQAIEDIKEDEIINVEPMIKLDGKTLGLKSNIRNYVWSSKIEKDVVYLINGLGSYCNHADNTNLAISMDEKKLLCEFKARKNIKKGEELLVNYGKNWFEKRKKESNRILRKQSSRIFKMY